MSSGYPVLLQAAWLALRPAGDCAASANPQVSREHRGRLAETGRRRSWSITLSLLIEHEAVAGPGQPHRRPLGTPEGADQASRGQDVTLHDTQQRVAGERGSGQVGRIQRIEGEDI